MDKSETRVLANTPLAAAIVPAGENRPRRIVLYFIGAEDAEEKLLYHAHAVLGEKTVTFDKVEEQPVVFKTADQDYNLKDWAGLATYLDEPRQRVVVFGLTTKTKNEEPVFAAIPHPWGA